MNKRIKYIGLFLLYLAGLIIVAHSIIPHHHHLNAEFDHSKNEKTHHHHHDHDQHNHHHHKHDHEDHEHKSGFTLAFGNHEHSDPLNENHCHFNITITNSFEKVSIDAQLISCENTIQIVPLKDQIQTNSKYQNCYNFLYYSKQSTRGPPYLS